MNQEPPFKPGDRVRLTEHGRRQFGKTKTPNTVVRCYWSPRGGQWLVFVKKNNLFAASFWELDSPEGLIP